MAKIKTQRASKAAVAAQALAILARLAHRGAYAKPIKAPANAADTCPVYSPRNGFAEPLSHEAQPAIAYALHHGWLTHDQDGTRVCISAAGRRALRTAKSGGSGISPVRTRRDAINRSGNEGALAWLRQRRDKDGRPLITEVQFNAGEKLAADFWQAEMSPRVTANWSAAAPVHRMRRVTPGLGVDMRDAVVSARQRFHRALDAVGPELAGVLVDVCCHDMGLEASGQASGWPQRAAKVVLDLALTRLARHYGFLAPERPAIPNLRHWGDADYRPNLESWR